MPVEGRGHALRGPFWLLVVALDLMLEALGDSKGLAGVPDWPGDARMGWIALPSGREHCFTRIQGSRGQPKWRVDLEFLVPTINQTTA